LEELITVHVLQLAQLAPLADGPAYYFGSTIMTFALPFGALIAAYAALFFLFRTTHSGPRLRWSSDSAAHVASVTTREPGPAPAPEVIATSSVAPVAPDRLEEAAPEPLEEDVLAEQALAAEAPTEEAAPPTETPADKTDGTDETDGKDGEEG
jgi:hypothetical protein